jgi:tRNA dimethylallyltransferase
VFDSQGKDDDLRARLQEVAESQGNIALHRRLAVVDPDTAKRLHPNDRRRVIRALEIYHTTGQPLSQHLDAQKQLEPRYQAVKFGLARNRPRLYQRIDARVDQMIEAGLLDEVKNLLEQGLAEGATAMQALGYKELVGYLRGEYDLAEAIRLLKRDTRRYAKRQLTWFRRDEEIIWLDLDKLTIEDATDKIATTYWRNLRTKHEI